MSLRRHKKRERKKRRVGSISLVRGGKERGGGPSTKLPKKKRKFVSPCAQGEKGTSAVDPQHRRKKKSKSVGRRRKAQSNLPLHFKGEGGKKKKKGGTSTTSNQEKKKKEKKKSEEVFSSILFEERKKEMQNKKGKERTQRGLLSNAPKKKKSKEEAAFSQSRGEKKKGGGGTELGERGGGRPLITLHPWKKETERLPTPRGGKREGKKMSIRRGKVLSTIPEKGKKKEGLR